MRTLSRPETSISYLAGVHGSRTHPGRDHRPATVLKTAKPTGTLPLPHWQYTGLRREPGAKKETLPSPPQTGKLLLR